MPEKANYFRSTYSGAINFWGKFMEGTKIELGLKLKVGIWKVEVKERVFQVKELNHRVPSIV